MMTSEASNAKTGSASRSTATPNAVLTVDADRAIPADSRKPLFVQRKCACGGKCSDCELEERIQPKLEIGAPNDVYEQEAERVADHVMNVSDRWTTVPSINRGNLARIRSQDGARQTQAKPLANGSPTCSAGRSKKATPELRSKAAQTSNVGGAEAPHAVTDVLHSPGQALHTDARLMMESRFGRDFAQVRVHNDRKAWESADRVRALAYTVGQDIVFGMGQYAPSTHAGRKLIAHELTHVVQQGGSIDSSKGGGIGGIGGDDTSSGEKRVQQSPLGGEATDVTNVRLQRAPVPGESPEVGVADAPEDASPGLKTLSVCVQPVQIADEKGKRPTTLPSFVDSNIIWAKCCIDLSIQPAMVVSNPDYKVLDLPRGETPSPEVSNLFNDAGVSGDCIWVFVADMFTRLGHTNKDVAGGGKVFDAGFQTPKVVVVEGIHPTIVAHEIGHAMGYQGHAAPAGTVMLPSRGHSQPVKENIASILEASHGKSSICDRVRQFVSAKPGERECSIKHYPIR